MQRFEKLAVRRQRAADAMVPSLTSQDLSTERRQMIVQVSRQALVFAETSAAHVGETPLNDPNIQAYYLVYVLGAIDYLGDQVQTGGPFSVGEKLATMAEALATFDVSSAEEIRTTVVDLSRAHERPAMRLRAEGRRAAAKWTLGDKDEAARRFAELMRDPDNLPLPLEPALAALAAPES